MKVARTLLCSIALSGVLVVGAIAQTSDAPAAAPQWVKAPSASLDPLSWPERALRLEVDGEATLTCGYDAHGVLRDCRVVAESPKGFAFGLAALRMTRVFKLRPLMTDGSALVPGEITFPVKFVASEFSDPRRSR